MEVLTVKPSQMKSWEEICEAFAKKVKAKLLFVNSSSCGIEYSDGSFAHVYIEEMEEFLKGH